MTLKSLQCALYTLHYAAILFLTYQAIPNPFHIESDASSSTIGGVLTQEHAYVNKPIAFLSKTLTSSE